MKCPKCGNPNIKEGQKFCTKCGAPLSALWQTDEHKKSVRQQAGSSEGKGLIDNITHFGTFLQRGSRGVQQEVRREREERVRQQAEAAGFEVSKPPRNEQQPDKPQSDSQPQVRRVSVDTDSVEGISIVQGRAIWNIQRGQVARLVTETELANADGLKGVIVQEGCTAMVYVDGQLMSIMQAGVYTFPSKSEADLQMEQRQREIEAQQAEIEEQEWLIREEQRKRDNEYARTFQSRGVFGEAAAFGRGVFNFLFGHRMDESAQQHKRRVERTIQKIKLMPAPKICRIYLVSNRLLTLMFSPKVTATGDIDFTPLVIPTKLVDVQMGVTMTLQITNLNQFSTNYLADKQSVSLLDLAQMVEPGLKVLLTQTLRNLDYQQEGLPEQVVENLKNKIRISVNERLQGIEVIQVLDITDQSADFDRFRSVEHQLFASEKELDFLQRTGEFRNRLEQEQNKQSVDRATNAEQLRKALQKVNTDKLLREDEMEQWVLMLQSQKRLREAKTKEEEYEALSDLKKSQLVKEDDVEALQNTLQQGKISRENVTEIMRIQAEQKADMERQIAVFALSDKKDEHDMAAELRKAQHAGDLTQAAIARHRMEDEYSDERRQKDDDYGFSRNERQRNATNQQTLFEEQLRQQKEKAEHERQRQNKIDDMDILERKAALAKQNMQAMQEAELAKQKEQNRSQESLHAMDTNEQVNRDNLFANMSTEQIKAAQLSHLTNDAQVAMAQSYGSEKMNELQANQRQEQKELYEQMMRSQQNQSQQSQDAMMKMAQMMQQGIMGVAQQRYEDQVAMKNEYRENASKQQDRMDQTQALALGAMGKVSAAAAGNINAYNGGLHQQPLQQSQSVQKSTQKERICPACGAEVPEGEMFCPECGQKI